MNTVIPVNSLIAMLAMRANLSEDDARKFVNSYFAIIEESLGKGEQVTIKGLGTFVNDNGSVRFTPDDSLTALVNAPFEMFSAIELEEGDIVADTPDEEPSPAPTQAEPEPLPEPTEPIVQAKPAERITVEHTEQPIVKEPIVEETAGEETDSDAQDDGQDTDAVYDYGMADTTPATGTNRCCIALWSIAGLVVGLIIGVCAGYVGRDKISMLLGHNTPAVDNTAALATDTAAVPDTTSGTALSVDTMPVVLTQQDIDDINNPVTDPESTVAADSQHNTTDLAKEPRYDTIGKKRYLTTMAKQYYGHQDYWVYIYQANASKLKHPDRIKPGTKVIIPDFDEYRTSDDPAQNREDAHQLGLKIYSKYK